MLIIHKDLKPVLIKEYNELFELIVVEISTQITTVRKITGYGPQENLSDDEIMPFWVALEEEISSAELNGRSVIIQMDANAKLGKSYIQGDPHNMSVNGRVFSGIIERHALIVLNGLENKCTGIITRERHTVESIEKSVIDFILTSNDIGKHVKYMHVDEERNNVLAKIVRKKGNIEVKETDHNTITAELSIYRMD